MVMALAGECDPKCYVCHEAFASMDDLRDHQQREHGARPGGQRGPAPGDVSVF